MINSANSLDFSVKRINNEMLPAEMLPSTDKYNLIQASNIPQGTATRLLPKPCSELFTYVYAPSVNAAGAVLDCTAKTKDIERVQVQHLQPPTKLQNNRWNYHSFYNLNATAETDAERVTTQNYNNNKNNIRNDSAFKKCYTVGGEKQLQQHVTSAGTETNNNSNERKSHTIPATGDSHQKMTASDSGDRRISPIHRTEDQENAFRRIEDVHNYAKLNRYSRYSHESSNSTLHDEEEDDEEEEEEEGDDDMAEEEEEVDLDTNYERFFRNKPRSYSSSAADNLKTRNAMQKLIKVRAAVAAAAAAAAEETEPHVDVETVPKGEQFGKAMVNRQPDHHARRPMNAFLIFCKRHRAIVKERYKSLENRAITKILGDWWASLDINDKKCFTNLAQQNKDAFFSANPNFKWYKLPAPPLRTLNTRPSNAAERGALPEHELFEADESHYRSRCSSNYFKLADEAQMGELSTLMSAKSHALQQALGETTQFLSAHIPPHSDELGGGTLKRTLHSDNSVSSNSSEDDGGAAQPAKKSVRSCKGKIYQELINSGQISATTKKLKAPKLQNPSQSGYVRQEALQQQQQQHQQQLQQPALEKAMAALVEKGPTKRTVSESAMGQLHHFDLANFDLEEKIKELPALSLDTYLLRKRSTKKKKKFTAKKRNSNNATTSSKSSSSTSLTNAAALSPPATPPKESAAPAQTAAVGSQKRKARKESITRRDVSAIENEVASLIPLTNDFSTIRGCYYYNESPSASPSPPSPSTLTAHATTKAISHRAPSSSTLGEQQQQLGVGVGVGVGVGDFKDNISSSTSDLFILAEVAANRTELTN